MDVSVLPAVNAALNGTCAVLLVMGKRHIRRNDRVRHRKTMIAAFCVSVVFLISYLTYHAFHGVTTFKGPEWARITYLVILGSHTILAAAVVPLAVMALLRGLREKFALHKKIARWAHPIWLYVSVTGVIVYLMLYQIFV